MARTRKQVAAQLKAAKASAAKRRKKVQTPLERNQKRAAMIRAMNTDKSPGGEIKAAKISSTIQRADSKKAKRLTQKYGSTQTDNYVRATHGLISASSLARSAREPAGVNPKATNASGVMVGKKIAK